MEKVNEIIAEIKDELEKMEVDVDSKDARASLRYVREALIEESRKSADKRVVGKNGARTLAGMIAKWRRGTLRGLVRRRLRKNEEEEPQQLSLGEMGHRVLAKIGHKASLQALLLRRGERHRHNRQFRLWTSRRAARGRL